MDARIQNLNGRPALTIDGRPTTEFWCYGWPNAIADFAAAGLRICQFHVEGPSWWTGPARYDFSRVERQIEAFVTNGDQDVLLIPRVCFGFQGEGWWAEANRDQLSVGLDLDGRVVDYRGVGPKDVECWHSAGSERWARDASEAIRDFVRHLERTFGDLILGYQIGAGISVEWFRWWTFVEGVYEDYSQPARDAFRSFLQTRYATDAALRTAWQRSDACMETAEIPHPHRIHAPRLGFLRNLPGGSTTNGPDSERDVVDWLECLSELNAGQLIALCRAAKQACGHGKLVGSFYGYVWPHWNTQNPARSGHLAIDCVLACPEIDYISAPYHYDNRGPGGAHHSQTVPLSIQLAGKLHMDEIDTFTHLTCCDRWPEQLQAAAPRTAAEACALLRRDAAAVLGTGGGGWWMDLVHEGWYADAGLQDELASLNVLARQAAEWGTGSNAQLALVIDDRSYACCDVNSNANLYFTSLPRQFEWNALGFPIDQIRLADLRACRDYRVYVFLNCWLLDASTRAMIREKTRRPGVTSVWFYAAGFFDERGGDLANAAELTGVEVEMCDEAVLPEIEIASSGHALLDDRLHTHTPRGDSRFGARLHPSRARLTCHENPRGWDTALSPVLYPDAAPLRSADTSTLGRFLHNQRAGLICTDRDGSRTVWSGAPMLPGWLLRRIAASAGVHLYAPAGCTVRHRGELISVHATRDIRANVAAPPGKHMTRLVWNPRSWLWESQPSGSADIAVDLNVNETAFFLAG